MGVIKGIKIETAEVLKIEEQRRLDKLAFEFRAENYFPLVGKGLQGDLAKSSLRLKEITITPDLKQNSGVRYVNLSLTESKSRTTISPKLAIAMIALAGAIGVTFKNPEIAQWVVEKIKTFGSFLALGLLPTLGMVMGGEKKVPTKPLTLEVSPPEFKGYYGSKIPESLGKELMSLLPKTEHEALHFTPLKELHIAIVDPADMGHLVKKVRERDLGMDPNMSESEAQKLLKEKLKRWGLLFVSKPQISGIGTAADPKDGHTVYYALVDWPEAQALRQYFKLPPKDLYIILASTALKEGRPADVYDVSKKDPNVMHFGANPSGVDMQNLITTWSELILLDTIFGEESVIGKSDEWVQSKWLDFVRRGGLGVEIPNSVESFTQLLEKTPRLNEDQMRITVSDHPPDPHFHFPSPIRFSDPEESSRFHQELSKSSHPLTTIIFEGEDDRNPFSMQTMGEFYHQGKPVKMNVTLYLELEDSLRPQHYLIQIVTDGPLHETSIESDEIFDTYVELHTFDHSLAEKIHRQFVEIYVRTGSVEEALKWLLGFGLN